MGTDTAAPTTISSPLAGHPIPSRITFADTANKMNNYHSTRPARQPQQPPPSYKSRSSSSASASSSSTTSAQDLQSLALNLLDTLYNAHDLSHASTLIHPNVTLTHNDAPITIGMPGSRETYLEYWRARTANSGARWSCREAVVDEAQRKVWCVGEVVVGGAETGLSQQGGNQQQQKKKRKESVDMLSFDEQGMLVGEEDWVRVVRWRDEAD